LREGFAFATGIRLDEIADQFVAAQRSGQPQPTPDDPNLVVYHSWIELPDIVRAAVSEADVSELVVTPVAIPDSGAGPFDVAMMFHASYTLPNGEPLHLVKRHVEKNIHPRRLHLIDRVANRHLNVRYIFLLLVIALVYLVGKYLSSSTQRLIRWIDSVSINDLAERAPRFNFVELDHLASRALSTMRREQQYLERGQQFLRFASHELRTPLSIAKANRHRCGAGRYDEPHRHLVVAWENR